MPLIGYYKGRDKVDTVFKQDYVLTLIPLGINASGAVPIFSPLLTTSIPLTGGQAQFSDTFGTPSVSAVTIPLTGASAGFSDTFGPASIAATIPLTGLQGGT